VFAKFGLLMARSSFLAPRSSHPKEGHLGKRRNRQDCSRNEESSESQGESLSE
jgi:hypothetical protein